MTYEGVEYELKLKDEFSKPLKDAHDAAKGFHESVLHIVEALGLVEAAKETFEFFKESFGEYQEHATAVASLTQMYNNNRDSMSMNLQQLQELAEEQQKKNGIDAESVMGAEQNLMKFRDIKISYEELIPVIGDFAAATKTDAASAADTLGRALENPERAMKLLMAAGVGPEQIESIQNLQKMGKTAQAQQEIFESLKEKYQGVAQAIYESNPGAQIEIEMKDIKETIGELESKLLKALMPAIKSVIESVKHFIEYMKEHKDTIIAVAKVVGTLAAAYVSYRLTVIAIEAPIKIATMAQYAWNAAMEANPIGLIVAGVVALVAALVHMEEVYNRIIASVQENRVKGMKNEIETVGKLADGYKDLTKEQAINAAIQQERGRLMQEYKKNQEDIKNTAWYDKDALKAVGERKLQLEGQMAALNDPAFIKKQLAERDKAAMAAGTKVNHHLTVAPKADKVAGPSHITINMTIQKMVGVEKMITTTIQGASENAGKEILKLLNAATNQWSASTDI